MASISFEHDEFAWQPLLSWLDSQLEAAVRRRSSGTEVEAGAGVEAFAQQLAGMYVDASSSLRALHEQSLYAATEAPSSFDEEELAGTTLGWMSEELQLSEFEQKTLILGFAAEVYSGYGRVFGFLNDDLTRRRPTLGLAFELFGGANGVATHFDSFSSSGRLQKFGLIEVTQDEGPRSSWAYRLAAGAFRRLTGSNAVDPELESLGFAVMTSRPFVREPEGCRSLLGSECRRFVIAGASGVGKTRAILEMVHDENRSVIPLDAALLAGLPVDRMRQVVAILARDTALFRTIVHIVCNDAAILGALLGPYNAGGARSDSEAEISLTPRGNNTSVVELCRGLDRLTDDTVIALETRIPVESVRQLNRSHSRYHVIAIHTPDVEQRQRHWNEALVLAGLDAAEARDQSVDLSTAFRLNYGEIEASVREAKQSGGVSESIWNAARSRASGRMEALAQRIEPSAEWDDLVISEQEREQLRDLVRRVQYRSLVIGKWGFGNRLGHGTGVNALFAGPPGTGKTMAAEVLANELKAPLYRIDCSSVVSKYIGETEKNLERIFAAAQSADAIIFFDEADSLFGKRTSITDAHDRYANIETSYLLQRIERHEGLVILATNLFNNIDSAFIRRITQLIHFRQPDETSRQKIWTRVWPDQLPLSDGVLTNLPLIARRFDVNGGSIKNAALTAAFLAAEGGDESGPATVQMEHIVAALAQEYRKLGKSPERFDWTVSPPQVNPLNGGRS